MKKLTIYIVMFLNVIVYGESSNVDNNADTNTEISVNKQVSESDNFDKGILIRNEQFGLLGSKPIKFVFTKVNGNKIEGYNILVDEKNFMCEEIWDNDDLFSSINVTKRPVSGTFVAIKKSSQGIDYYKIKVILSETGVDKWDGKFEFNFDTSWGGGSGTWKSFNGKLARKLEICGFGKRLLVGIEPIGLLGSKPIKFVFTKVNRNKVEGYNILVNEKKFTCEEMWDNDDLLSNVIKQPTQYTKRPFSGIFVIKKGERFINGEEVKVILSEPGTDEWDGKFEFNFHISEQTGAGNGTWKSFNGKLTRKLEICFYW